MIHITDSYKCNCGASFEDDIHYFLECPLYLNERKTLLSDCDDITINIQGRIQDFKLGGAHLKKIALSEGMREKFFGYFV
jgi:hypothetical protein